MRRIVTVLALCLSLGACADTYAANDERPQYTVRSENVGTIAAITAGALVLLGLAAL